VDTESPILIVLFMKYMVLTYRKPE